MDGLDTAWRVYVIKQYRATGSPTVAVPSYPNLSGLLSWLLLPVLAVAMGCVLLSLGLGEYVVPAATRARDKIFEERIQHLANYDNLTGLPNRMLFYDRLRQAIHLAGRNRNELSLLYLDLDKFKTVNDTLDV